MLVLKSLFIRYFARALKEAISTKIAILKTGISQSGKLGLTNVHKHCENLVMKLLNMVYDYKLIDRNVKNNNFGGSDIGDEGAGIAYQVSSDKSSEKVNKTLKTVLKDKLYEKFPTIRMFILGDKQGSYTITEATDPHFVFDLKVEIKPKNGV